MAELRSSVGVVHFYNQHFVGAAQTRSAGRLGTPKRPIAASALLGSMTKFSAATSVLLVFIYSAHGDGTSGKSKLKVQPVENSSGPGARKKISA